MMISHLRTVSCSSPCAPRWWWSLAAAALWGSLALAGLCACSDKSKHLRPGDAYRYKLELLKRHNEELAPHQCSDFMSRPGRTRGEIDGILDDYRAEFRRIQEIERARLAAEMEAEREDARAGGDEAAESGDGEGRPAAPDPLSEDEGEERGS
ncbi:MAG: hypothetical protein JXA90_04400 [Planctomycetes bacterium]|nr:hypothetical protein [Planctomycetota bacterium]